MAEREVCVEFVFERTGESCLAQAYRILVPERRARTRLRSGHHDKSDAGQPGPARPSEQPTASGQPAAAPAESGQLGGRGCPGAGASGAVELAASGSS